MGRGIIVEGPLLAKEEDLALAQEEDLLCALSQDYREDIYIYIYRERERERAREISEFV